MTHRSGPTALLAHPSLPLLLVALVLSLAAAPGWSQVEATRTAPEDGSTETSPARALRVWFPEAPDPAKSSLELEGPEGPLSVTGLHTMGENDLMARVSGRMPDGEYAASWTFTGTSGSSATGSWSFSIARGGASSAATSGGGSEDGPIHLGIVLYPGWEPLDVFGPLEMFMNVGYDRLRIHMLAEEAGPVASSAGSYPEKFAPRVIADTALADAPKLDIILVPGGFGTFAQLENETLLEWLDERSGEARYMASVCTGSAILAKAGVLDGKKATGNKMFFSFIAGQGEETEWVKKARWVDDGSVITSSGVSAGIDMALGIIANLFGEQAAMMIAAGTEYEWHRDASEDPFTQYLDMGMPGIEAAKAAHSK